MKRTRCLESSRKRGKNINRLGKGLSEMFGHGIALSVAFRGHKRSILQGMQDMISS